MPDIKRQFAPVLLGKRHVQTQMTVFRDRNYLGLMLWGGLWLRDLNLRALLPFHR